MKRLTMIAVALLAMCSVAFAQQSKTDETLEFRPHWSLGIQGGAALFCTHMVGDYYNVMGLPVCRLGQVLREMAPDLMGDML